MTTRPASDRCICAVCGGSLADGIATLPFVRDERVVVVRGVPAEICGDCGEAYLAGEVVDGVQKIVDDLDALDAEVSVARYRAA
jgi:YgiT-type zinc finger domain-containing protein